MKIFLFVGLLLLVSCKSDDPVSSLESSWVWVKSSGGIAGTEYTPESTGLTQKRIFTSDKMFLYHNGQVVNEVPYHLETRNVTPSDPNDSGERLFLVTNQFEYIVFLNGNELVLVEQCADCFVHQFVRRIK